MRIRNIIGEARGLEDPELIDFILTDVQKRRRYGKLLLAGFDGQKVVAARSFGERWHTYALTAEEAMEAETGINEYDSVIEFAVEEGTMPVIAVFNGDKLKPVANDDELYARYCREKRHELPADLELPLHRLYGVAGPSLDVAALAVYRFGLGHNTVWTRELSWGR